jgi:hypothetical protein
MAEWTLFKMRDGENDEPVVTVINAPADVPQWKIRRGLKQRGYDMGWGTSEIYYLALNSTKRAQVELDYNELETERSIVNTTLRLPQALHKKLSELSFHSGESLNSLIVEAVRQFLLAQEKNDTAT